jgi:hypothetical protein
LAVRCNPGTPKNLVCHPIPNARKPALEKKNRLNRSAAVTRYELSHPRFGELRGKNIRRARRPPGWRVCAVMEADPTKLSRVSKNKRPLLLSQDKVIVFLDPKTSRLYSELPGHTKMNPKPAPNIFASPDSFGVVAGKSKKHLLSVRNGTAQFLTGKPTSQSSYVLSSKDPFLSVQLHRANGIADPDVPLFPKILHLGQLWHAGRLERS